MQARRGNNLESTYQTIPLFSGSKCREVLKFHEYPIQETRTLLASEDQKDNYAVFYLILPRNLVIRRIGR